VNKTSANDTSIDSNKTDDKNSTNDNNTNQQPNNEKNNQTDNSNNLYIAGGAVGVVVIATGVACYIKSRPKNENQV
jgi:hypothetical protein